MSLIAQRTQSSSQAAARSGNRSRATPHGKGRRRRASEHDSLQRVCNIFGWHGADVRRAAP